MIVTRTPYRLSLFGGGTDYNAWFESNGGLVLGCAMKHYCYISIRRLPPFFSEYKTRVVYSAVELVKNNEEIKHPSIRGCLDYLNIKEGVEIHHQGDLPSRSGIGSSSSFTVGLLNSLHALNGRAVGKEPLAEQAINVEQKLLGESVGIQDQIMASYGGFQTIEMGLGSDWTVKPLIVSKDFLEEFSKHILIGFTGVTRFANAHAEKKIANIKDSSIDEELIEMMAIASDAKSLFEGDGHIEEIGTLLDRNWAIKRRLSASVTDESIDQMYSIGKRNGAFGGKLMGAGGGGFFYFLAPPDTHEAIKFALHNINVWIPFSVDYSGSSVVVYNPV